jgi:hypothetical protein
VNTRGRLPDLNRVSVIISLVLLAYASATIISFPTQVLDLQLPGFLLSIEISYITIMALVVAVLMGAGVDWLISTHPQLADQPRWQHWLIPAFTAAAIGIPLGALPISPAWWSIFALGGVLLTSVLVAEYVVLDSTDRYYPFASLGLIGVSFALFFLIVVSIYASGARLYILLAGILPTVFLITARTLYLRLHGVWRINWAIAIAIILTQIAAGLFYLGIKPLQLGLILFGFLYGLTALATNLEEKQPTNLLWVEPTLMTGVFIILGLVS